MLLINFASRSRPQKFADCLKNIHDNLTSNNFLILASLDTDDASMNNDEVKSKLSEYPNVYPIWGESKSKIHAINRSMEKAPDNWSVVINTSDDVFFVQKGFDEIIMKEMQDAFPDYDGVIHAPDQNQGRNCMTVSIIGKKYYDRDKYIYHPSYKSLWCDLEAQEVAQIRGCYKFIDKHLFNHNHPSFGQCQYDAQYLKTESMEVRNEDEQIYRTRQLNNFYISGK